MNKHPYYQLLNVMRKQRNTIIEEFRFFKRSPVNRKWISHSSFSHTVNHFRHKLAEIDKVIALAKTAIQVSNQTGVMHWFSYESNTIYAEK